MSDCKNKRPFSGPNFSVVDGLPRSPVLISKGNSTRLPPKDPGSIVHCKICDKSFIAKKNLNRHIKKFHPTGSIPMCDELLIAVPESSESVSREKAVQETDELDCKVCGKTFTKKANCIRHKKQFHSLEENSSCNEPTQDQPRSSLVCPVCSEKIRAVNELYKHIERDHGDVNLKHLEIEFDSRESFESWKTEIESKTHSRYVKHYGSKPLAGGVIASYYYCHRSGMCNPKVDRSRRLKLSGSNKIGCTCPAAIRVEESTESSVLKVKFQSTHVGHHMDIGRTILNKVERDELAVLLHQGVPKSVVLNKIRSTYSPTKRKSYTVNKDLHNICRDYNIEKDVIFHMDDATSVDILVSSMRKEEGNPVLLYKPIGEVLDNPKIPSDDFLLAFMTSAQLKVLQLYGKNGVMIDSTHGMNQYGFLLSTLMVNDDNHEGLPVAVLYSSKANTETFEVFFQAIKDRLPEFQTETFMSDDAPAMYNAWKLVFGSVNNHLLCLWHVERAWNSNLNSKIKSAEIRADIKNELSMLSKEIDQLTFAKMLENFIGKIKLCKDTADFAEYFELRYSHRVRQWAACYRIGCGVNVNMKLERWHRQLKYEEAGAKAIKRLDRSISLVRSAITKRLIGRVIAMERPKLTTKVTEIRKRHERSCQIPKDMTMEMKPHEHWVVLSSQASSNFQNTYDVSRLKVCGCSVRCDECEVCIHEMGCTCYDYAVRFVICKHIHAVCTHHTWQQNTAASSQHAVHDLIMDLDPRKEIQAEESGAINNELKKSVTDEDLQRKKDSVMANLLSLVPLIEKSEDASLLEVINDGIKHLKSKCSMHEKTSCLTSPFISGEISQKRSVEPQKRFLVSTKGMKRKLFSD